MDAVPDTGGFPLCQRCRHAALVPLSDYGGEGASLPYKTWACTDPDCGFSIKIRRGDISIDEPIWDGAVRDGYRD